MQRFSIFQRGILIPLLLISLVFGLLASNAFIGRTAFRKYETNEQTISDQSQNSLDNLPVYFEENRELPQDKVRYVARGNGGATLFLTAAEAVYVLRSPVSGDVPTSIKDRKPKFEDSAVAVHMKLSGANGNAMFAGEEQLEHRTNYIRGSDSAGWQTGIPNYRRVLVNDIYDGVDMVWQGKMGGEVQYDFILKPNANPEQIEWRIEGARKILIDADGSLLIETELGALRQRKPFSYQDSAGLRTAVKSGYVLSSNLTSNTANRNSFTVKFEVGDYDRSKNLTIDPSVNLSNLAFSTLLGGAALDNGTAIAVDLAGNVYVTGTTLSTQFPTTTGTVDTSQNGANDVFVTKLSASGTLIYSTFIGGDFFEGAAAIAIDASGNAYLTGQTKSTNYPTTAGAFKTSNTSQDGTADIFVTKLNPTGAALAYSTFIGGSSSDIPSGIAVDKSGNAYVIGATRSADYPTTAGAFDTSLNGPDDVFVTKLNPTGSAQVYSTFIGGSSIDTPGGIAVDSSSGKSDAYLTGFTSSADYPTTTGAFDTTHNGLSDIFVTKLNKEGAALVYSTFIGGTLSDEAGSIAIDSSGNSYLTGNTRSTNYPTLNAFDSTHNGGRDVFVTKLNAGGSALIYSTLVGGTSNEGGQSIAVDSSGIAYVTGGTSSANYPTTPGAFDTTIGLSDVFVTKLNPIGKALVYSTFIGGTTVAQAFGIAIDSPGNIYVTGTTFPATSGTDYPTTPETVQPNFNGNAEVFVSKLGDFAISGQAVDEAGLPLANVAVAMSGARSGVTLTDGQGYFGFTDTIRANFTVAATHPGFNFTPNNFQINPFTRNQEFIFLGRPITSGPNIAAKGRFGLPE